MYWLNIDWIVGNWAPLVVALVLGYLLGWLLTGLPARRRATENDARVTELEGRHRKADRDLNELRRESEPLRSRLAALQTDLDEARTRTADLEKSRAALEEERDALRAAHAADEAEPEAEPAEDDAAAGDGPAAEERGQDADPNADPDAGAAPSIEAGFAALARAPEAIQGPSSQEVALREAYNRLAELQHALEERDQAVAYQHAELERVRAELLTAQASLRELEARHIRAREDVASELAVLASTMIKMKDDALARADARISTLNAELEAARAVEEAVGPGTRPGTRSMATAE